MKILKKGEIRIFRRNFGFINETYYLKEYV
jgi:hypothetical protein